MRPQMRNGLVYLCLLLVLYSTNANEDDSHENEERETHGSGGEEEADIGGTHVNGEKELACEEEHGAADVVLLLFFMILLGLVVRYALRVVPVPYTALLLIVGLLLGVTQIHMTKRGDSEGDGHQESGESHVINGVRTPRHERWEKFARGIDSWQGLEPELMLLVFLPALIFSSAFSLEFHITKRSFGQVLVLAGPGVVIGTVLTALFVKYVFPYDWCWPKAFMFGAMISATDPVAVVALLKEVGASKRLGTVIEGESLFNDGTAFVFFLLFRDMIPTSDACLNDKENCSHVDPDGPCEGGRFVPATPAHCLKDRDLNESIRFFVQLALGGPAIGILFGLAATFWIQYIYNDLLTEISLTLAAAYLTFYVAEDVAEVSGVLAVVALGLFMGSFAKDRISSAVHEPMHVFWEMMEYLANTLIFVYTGLKISVELFDTTNPSSDFISSREWEYAILLYLMLQIIRFITIFSLLPILKRMGYGMTWKDAIVAVWGGLRGAVGLALALIVQLDVRHIPPSFRSYTIFYLGFVVIATLTINGTTMPYLLKWLGVTKPSPEKMEVLFHILNEMEDCGEKLVTNISDDLLGVPDHREVHRLTALDLSRVIPTKKEINSVISTAKMRRRPSSIGIQEGLNARSVRRYHSSNSSVLSHIDEELDTAAHDRVVEVNFKKQQSLTNRIQAWVQIRWRGRSKRPHSPDRSEFTPDMLVQDLRSRLLQGVKTAYAEWLEKGYINAKAMFDLIASTDYSIDRLDSPVCDWKYIEKVATPSRWRVEMHKLKRYTRCGMMSDAANKFISKMLFENLFYSVLLARTFIMAHAEAEHTLHEHIKAQLVAEEDSADPRKMRLLEEAVETVLGESQDSTKAAYELLRNFKMVYPEILRAIRTRLSAQEVLLEKQAFLGQIESAGLIENREATQIQHMIDARIKFLCYNTLSLDMPNTHDLVHSHSLFVQLKENVFDSSVWPHAKPKIFTKGDEIYTIGSEPRHVTIVIGGLVSMVDANGRQTPIGDGFGSVIGAAEIILQRPRAMSMLCETTSEVIQFDKQIFDTFVNRFETIRIRAWQLTGMMLTYLNPWGDFENNSILDLAAIFQKAQLREFDQDQELRIKTNSYLVTGTVREASIGHGSPRSITAPAPLGPGLGIYYSISAVKILRIPTPEGPGRTKSVSQLSNRHSMFNRGASSLSRMSVPVGYGQATGKLGEIPEGSTTEEMSASEELRTAQTAMSLGERSSLDHALSADLESKAAIAKRLRRQSVEL